MLFCLIALTNILSIVDIAPLQTLVGNLTVSYRPKVANSEISDLLWGVSSLKFTLKSLHVTNLFESLDIELRRVSSSTKKQSKFPNGDLYKLTMLIVLVCKLSLTVHASKPFSLQYFWVSTFENWRDS